MAKSGITSGQPDLWSDVPLVETSVAKFATTSGHADFWSDVPPAEVSSGQEWYYFRSG